MSLGAAISPGAQAFVTTPIALRPVWFRALALGLILTLHAALLLTVAGERLPSPIDAIEVSLAPLGDSAEDQQMREEIKPAEDGPSPPTPAERAEWIAPPPKIVASEAIPLPFAMPKPVIKPLRMAKEGDDTPTPAQLRAEKRRRQEAAERRKAQEGRQEARRGSEGAAASRALSHASYAAVLAAELNRHRVYPAAARAAGVTGSVGVAFTVGPSGRVVSHSITRSSGDPSLDQATHAIMNAVQAPPPPGGRFSTSTTIQFSLR
jgi:protein TonB